MLSVLKEKNQFKSWSILHVLCFYCRLIYVSQNAWNIQKVFLFNLNPTKLFQIVIPTNGSKQWWWLLAFCRPLQKWMSIELRLCSIFAPCARSLVPYMNNTRIAKGLQPTKTLSKYAYIENHTTTHWTQDSKGAFRFKIFLHSHFFGSNAIQMIMIFIIFSQSDKRLNRLLPFQTIHCWSFSSR